MERLARAPGKRLFVVYAICSLAAIFYLPYLVPIEPTASLSYVFGYNNRAGVDLLLLLVAVGAVWTKGLNLQFMARAGSPPVPIKTLAASLIAMLAGCTCVYAFAGRFGGFGESGYEIDHIWFASQGRVPYVDFELAYGPGFLYAPLLLQRLLHLQLLQAYYLLWGLSCLVGTWMLYTVVNMVDYPTDSKKWIFLLLYCSGYVSSVLGMGSHSTLLRFTCPLFFILVVQKFLQRDSLRWKLFSLVLATGFTIVLLSISPEIAVAHAFACTFVLLLSLPSRGGNSIALVAGWLVVLSATFWAALKLHLLDTFKANGKGADSLPIAFAPHFLLFFAALFVCSCYLYRRFSARRINDNTIGLILFAVPMVAAALGRCDPFHVVLDGLGIFLASMFYVSSNRAAWKLSRMAYIAFLVLLPALTYVRFSLPSMAKVGLNTLSESTDNSRIGVALGYLGKTYIAWFGDPARQARWEADLANARRFAAPKTIDFTSIYPSWHGDFLAPFGYDPNGIGTYLSDRVSFGHYDGFTNAYTVAAVHEKIAEMKDHPQQALLLPDYFPIFCKVDVPASRQMISLLFAFPYLARPANPESIRRPICDYVVSQYRLVQAPEPRNFGYGLWVANPANAGR